MLRGVIRFAVVFGTLWLLSFFWDGAQAQAPMPLPIDVRAKGVAVADLATGRILCGQNADRVLPMASTTKIMTAWLTLEQPGIDEPFVVDENAIRVEGSSMGLLPEDTVTLRALSHGMLLSSGNDAANAAAVRVGGTIPKFVRMMNARAQALGLRDTFFATPSGLDGEGHGSTAADMAKLASEALKNPDFAEICGKYSAKIQYGNPPYDRWLTNHNRLLKLYDNAIGVKTGFTKAAGRCLVSAAKREDGGGLVIVTLNCADDWNVHETLYRKLLPELETADVSAKGDYYGSVTGGENDTVGLTCHVPEVHVLPAEKAELDLIPVLQPILFAPIQRGQVVGTLEGVIGEERVFSVPLYAAEDVAAREDGFWF